jgi:hypothetical protein
MAFVLKSIDVKTSDKGGKQYTSGIIQPIDFIPSTEFRKEPTGTLQKAFLSILDTLIARAIESDGDEDVSAPDIGIPLTTWQKAVREAEYPNPRFHEVKKTLVKNGQILIVKDLVYRT